MSSNVGNWRVSRDQPLVIGFERRAVMTNGEVDLSTMPDGRKTSLRTYQQRAEVREANRVRDAKRGRRQRARARRRAA